MQTKLIEALLLVVLLLGGYVFIKKQAEIIEDLSGKLQATVSMMAKYENFVKVENESRKTYLNNLKEFAQNEKINRDAVAAGTKRVYIRAECPKPSETGVGAGTQGLAVIDTATERNIFDLRANVRLNEEKLTLCITNYTAALEELSKGDKNVCK